MIAVVTRAGHEVSAPELFTYSAAVLPRFAVPRYLRFVDALPKTPSERIKKYLLRQEGVTPDSTDRDSLGLVIARD